MCCPYTPPICTCELQFFFLFRFSLQIYTMFDNVSTEINFLSWRLCLLLYVDKLLTDFTPNFSVQFRAKSSVSGRLVLCSVKTWSIEDYTNRLQGWHTSMSKAVRLPGKFHHQIVPISTALWGEPSETALGYPGPRICY